MLRKKISLPGVEPEKNAKAAYTASGKPRTDAAAKKAANRAAVKGDRSAGKGAR